MSPTEQEPHWPPAHVWKPSRQTPHACCAPFVHAHVMPLSTAPSQSLSLLSHVSLVAVMAPEHALSHTPAVVQICVPSLHSPTAEPHARMDPGTHTDEQESVMSPSATSPSSGVALQFWSPPQRFGCVPMPGAHTFVTACRVKLADSQSSRTPKVPVTSYASIASVVSPAGSATAALANSPVACALHLSMTVLPFTRTRAAASVSTSVNV